MSNTDTQAGNDGSQNDDMTSNAEWDALQAQIDEAAKAVTEREEKPGDPQSKDTAPALSETEQQALRIEEIEAELTNAKDHTLRAMAETQNIKKRSEREVESI